MNEGKKLTLICMRNLEEDEDFKIFINGEDISEKSIRNNYSYSYSLTYNCDPGEYSLKVIQNNFVLSKWWWLLSFIYGFLSIISYSVDAYAEGLGPFYAIAEGKLTVTGDASVEIKLLGKRINMNRKTCRFQIQPKESCSWSESINDFVTNPKYKIRWIFAAILPMLLLVTFIVLLCGLLGMRAFERKEIAFGLFNAVIVIIALVAVIFHSIMVVKKANGR